MRGVVTRRGGVVRRGTAGLGAGAVQPKVRRLGKAQRWCGSVGSITVRAWRAHGTLERDTGRDTGPATPAWSGLRGRDQLRQSPDWAAAAPIPNPPSLPLAPSCPHSPPRNRTTHDPPLTLHSLRV